MSSLPETAWAIYEYATQLFRQSLAAAKRRIAPEAQAIFCRRRHQPRRPPLAKIRPGKPAPVSGLKRRK
jgi:hypothetical protein